MAPVARRLCGGGADAGGGHAAQRQSTVSLQHGTQGLERVQDPARVAHLATDPTLCEPVLRGEENRTTVEPHLRMICRNAEA